jgi:hypothetical protein
MVSVIEILRKGKQSAAIALRNPAGDPHDVIRIPDRQRPEHRRIESGEDGGVHPNTES